MMKHYTEFKPTKVGSCYALVGRGKWKKQVWYKDKPIVLDTESSSFKIGKEKRACLYIWQMNVFGDVYYGRKAEEVPEFLDTLAKAYNLDADHKAIIYVHNLAWDAQFLLPWMNVTRMFATDERKPLTFETNGCFVWRCSLRLSGKKLATLSEEWEDVMPELKKQENYNYDLLRTWRTPLTDLEMKYAEFDVLVLYKYIETEIAQYGTICNIPLTNTGRSRRIAKESCDKDKTYKFWFKKNTPTDPELYRMLRSAYMGGVTHANRIHTGIILADVSSRDLASSYPSQMVKRKYPSTPFKPVTIEDIDAYLKVFPDHALVMEVEIYGMRAKTYHSIYSASKTHEIKNLSADNGRIISADYLRTTITEVDYENIKMYYDMDKIVVNKAYTSKKKYLPTPFVKTVIDLYENKSQIKGNDDLKTQYALLKALLNSLYGMCVSNIVHDDILYHYAEDKDMWSTDEVNVNDDDALSVCLKDYADDPNSFLIYQTGVWISAYARNDLLTAMKMIIDRAPIDDEGIPYDDIVYYDTDSIKLLNIEKYEDIFEEFNKRNREMHHQAMVHHGWGDEKFMPVSEKGEVQILGDFDPDGTYLLFKTLGAKRYMYTDHDPKGKYTDDTVHITIAGINKKDGAEYINKLAKKKKIDPFGFFEDGMVIPAKNSGKTSCLYYDHEYTADVVDYLGIPAQVHELAYVYLEKKAFKMNILGDYKLLIENNKLGDVIV